MPIYKGADKVFEISLGGTPVTEVFRGATKIWPEAAPVVSIAPTSAANFAGTVINFTATATGAAITYQWNINGAPVSGQTGTTYAHTIAGNVSITCTVTDGYGQSTISNAAPITQQAAVAVSIAPTSGVGYAGAVINFTASPSGGNGSYTYQWKANGANIGGATASTYAHTIAGNTNITCVATSNGQPATSNSASITQYAALAASIAPTSGAGYAGTVVNYTATPSGGSGAYTYQWKANGANIGGATASTYAHTIAGNTSITCVVSSAGASVTSNSSAITQWAAVSASIAPTSYTGESGTGTTFTCTPGGGNGSYTYLWFKNGGSTGVATATYAYTSTLGDTGVYCRVTSAGQSVNSNTATLTITAPDPAIPYDNAILALNPVLYYKCSESSGNFNPTVGTVALVPQNGFGVGPPVYDGPHFAMAGNSGASTAFQAYQFFGGQSASNAIIASNPGFTVVAFLKDNGGNGGNPGTAGFEVSFTNPSQGGSIPSNGLGVIFTGDRVSFKVNSSSLVATPQFGLPGGQTRMVVWTHRDNSPFGFVNQCYVDGSLQTTSGSTGSITGSTAANVIKVGGNNSSAGSSAVGTANSASRVALFNKVLTAGEISNLNSLIVK